MIVATTPCPISPIRPIGSFQSRALDTTVPPAAPGVSIIATIPRSERSGSFPFDDNMLGGSADSDTIPDNGWGVQVNNEGDSGVGFAGYAVCGSATTVDQEYVVVTPGRTTTEATADGVRIIARPG